MTGALPPRGPMVGEDGLARCPWGTGDPLNRAYHDTEWGVPVHGERALFERITLEAFQSGLSWLTILRKRPAFRRAFAGFDAEVVGSYGDDDVARLMADASIVRNRAKIQGTVSNALATVALRARVGLDARIWSHQPPPPEPPRTAADLRPETAASSALARDLRAHGFAFVGPTTAHALMQAVGLVNDHLAGCHRRDACSALAQDPTAAGTSG